jgi:predicted Holliday junction resolvase-like endonuclease
MLYPYYIEMKYPIKKAHYVGTSVVLTIDPSHVDRLQIDEATFFIQKPVKDGILLQRCKLQFDSNEDLNSIHYDTVTERGTN